MNASEGAYPLYLIQTEAQARDYARAHGDCPPPPLDTWVAHPLQPFTTVDTERSGVETMLWGTVNGKTATLTATMWIRGRWVTRSVEAVQLFPDMAYMSRTAWMAASRCGHRHPRRRPA